MKKALSIALVLAALLLVPGPTASAAARNYGDYSMMFTKSFGLFAGGTQEWAWSPRSATESRITWGPAWTTVAPDSAERFVRAGAWVQLPGWFGNGTYYEVKVDLQWQAASNCRTSRTALPVGGPQYYVRWSVPAADYCLHAEGTITEQSSGASFRFVHQQVWSRAGSCPAPASGATDYICQHETWSDANGTKMALKLDRTQWLVRGRGPAQQIRQTFPSAWSSTDNSVGHWG